ncbi:hypothetical protein H696_00663 [Fonticula alba]|uniref:Brl1/Brr6 domain-containing protein n=1 Tax=Fonticula alba TaxID=691883 RepID=A0A058ZFI9_FONAL|nr:hypothetical protein H696_00663 [Fonticula alba]KCV73119.1 hypothetical protein H696_00663 [Fonticula alba]|eukprot:XP_009492820.1 hypothetical protein H696_00663 [Fonticula alba]
MTSGDRSALASRDAAAERGVGAPMDLDSSSRVETGTMSSTFGSTSMASSSWAFRPLARPPGGSFAARSSLGDHLDSPSKAPSDGRLTLSAADRSALANETSAFPFKPASSGTSHLRSSLSEADLLDDGPTSSTSADRRTSFGLGASASTSGLGISIPGGRFGATDRAADRSGPSTPLFGGAPASSAAAAAATAASASQTSAAPGTPQREFLPTVDDVGGLVLKEPEYTFSPGSNNSPVFQRNAPSIHSRLNGRRQLRTAQQALMNPRRPAPASEAGFASPAGHHGGAYPAAPQSPYYHGMEHHHLAYGASPAGGHALYSPVTPGLMYSPYGGAPTVAPVFSGAMLYGSPMAAHGPATATPLGQEKKPALAETSSAETAAAGETPPGATSATAAMAAEGTAGGALIPQNASESGAKTADGNGGAGGRPPAGRRARHPGRGKSWTSYIPSLNQALGFIQLLFNVSIVAGILYLLYRVYFHISSDIDIRLQRLQQDQSAVVNQCISDYNSNRCSEKDIPKALEKYCSDLLVCMQRNHEDVEQTTIMAQVLAGAVNAFFEQFSIRTVLLCALLIVVGTYITNLSLTRLQAVTEWRKTPGNGQASSTGGRRGGRFARRGGPATRRGYYSSEERDDDEGSSSEEEEDEDYSAGRSGAGSSRGRDSSARHRGRRPDSGPPAGGAGPVLYAPLAPGPLAPYSVAGTPMHMVPPMYVSSPLRRDAFPSTSHGAHHHPHGTAAPGSTSIFPGTRPAPAPSAASDRPASPFGRPLLGSTAAATPANGPPPGPPRKPYNFTPLTYQPPALAAEGKDAPSSPQTPSPAAPR